MRNQGEDGIHSHGERPRGDPAPLTCSLWDPETIHSYSLSCVCCGDLSWLLHKCVLVSAVSSFFSYCPAESGAEFLLPDRISLCISLSVPTPRF